MYTVTISDALCETTESTFVVRSKREINPFNDVIITPTCNPNKTGAIELLNIAEDYTYTWSVPWGAGGSYLVYSHEMNISNLK